MFNAVMFNADKVEKTELRKNILVSFDCTHTFFLTGKR